MIIMTATKTKAMMTMIPALFNSPLKLVNSINNDYDGDDEEHDDEDNDDNG